MNWRTTATVMFCVILMSGAGYTQYADGGSADNVNISPGIGFEYFKRTLSWDEGESSTSLKSYLLSFHLDFSIRGGFTLTTLGGLSYSNFDETVFEHLPITLALNVGEIKGFFLGGVLKRSLIEYKNLEIEGWGQFVYSHGTTQEWDIPGLNVDGKATGQPLWFRVLIGPVFKYVGFMNFTPYLSVAINKLWGTFKMDQEIQNLTGTQDKKFESEGKLNFRVGSQYDLTEAFHFKGELSAVPFSNKVDLGLTVRAWISF